MALRGPSRARASWQPQVGVEKPTSEQSYRIRRLIRLTCAGMAAHPTHRAGADPVANMMMVSWRRSADDLADGFTGERQCISASRSASRPATCGKSALWRSSPSQSGRLRAQCQPRSRDLFCGDSDGKRAEELVPVLSHHHRHRARLHCQPCSSAQSRAASSERRRAVERKRHTLTAISATVGKGQGSSRGILGVPRKQSSCSTARHRW